MKLYWIPVCVFIASLFLSRALSGTEYRVRTPTEISQAMQNAKPGDVLVMADGIWNNARIVFSGHGTEPLPILLRAETPGKVVLTGYSTLSIGGNWLVVQDLKFALGFLSTGNLIEFRSSAGVASHCRLTQCAVIDYNPPDLKTNYKWISMYGTNNRVDHCAFTGMKHIGVTLTVWPEAGIPNYHRIDYNYFGNRAVGWDNGFETIRIGTSDVSMSNSRTTVEYNLFEKSDGEVETVSNKTCENIYRYNTFLNNKGTLTLRHGNRCRVEGNFFLGNQTSSTGGVRVIGEDHQVINNYFSGLTGDGGRSAISLSNGVPNSPLDRYFQVKNALIAFNTFVNNKVNITLGEGANQELSLPPLNCTMANNLVYGKTGPLVVKKSEPVNLTWEGNLFFGATLGIPQPAGITVQDPLLTPATDGLYRLQGGSPAIENAVGDYGFVTDDLDGQPRGVKKTIGSDEVSDFPASRKPLGREDVGPEWTHTGKKMFVLLTRCSGRGAIRLDPPDVSYAESLTVSLTAIPDTGWAFNRWEDSLSGSTNPSAVIMDKDKVVTAVFVQSTGVEKGSSLASDFGLYQNYPNPFNGSTVIRYTLKRAEYVRLLIFDIQGGLVQTLIDGLQEQGSYCTVWRPDRLPSGVYCCRLTAGNRLVAQRKTVYLK